MKIFLLALALGLTGLRAESFDVFGGRDWTFYGGYEFPGAEGNLRPTRLDDREAVVLSFDFTKGGAYVAGRVVVEIPESAKTFSFAAKSDRPLKLTLRVKDSTDQIHTYKPVYDQAGEWQNFSVDLREDVAGHFGGANDGTIHFPIRQVTLGVVKDKAATAPGEIFFAAPISVP